MALSTNTFTYAGGAQTFTLALAFGYLNESDIQCFVVGELDGSDDQIFRAFTFDSEFVVRITDPLTVNDLVTVQRTVSKEVLVVDFETGGDITPANLMLLTKQSFMAQHELLDGRINGINLNLIVDSVEASEVAALASAAAALASEQAAAASEASASTDAGTAATDAATATTKAAAASSSASDAAGSASAAAADEILTNADAIATAADRVQTGLDAVATAADRVQTGLDLVSIGDSETNSAASAAAALVSEGLADADAIATAADRVQTGLDRTSAGQSATTATTQASNAATSAGEAAADAIATAADLVLTDADQQAAAASASAASGSASAASGSATAASGFADDAAASAASIDVSEFVKKDGSTAFTGTQSGITPTLDAHLATKEYVDGEVGPVSTQADLGVTNAATADAKAVTADGKAVAAQGTADTAITNAATADGKAVSAQGTADTAITNAATADAKAVTADGKAVAAQSTADGRATVASVALKADAANAALTGVPTAPTAAVDTDTTQIATTEFVTTALGSAGGGAFESQLLHVRDEKSSGTSGGNFASGSWRTRDLNAILTNEITDASVSSNVITLPAGTYDCEIIAPCSGGNLHKVKLRQTSATAADVLIGMSGSTANNAADTINTLVRGRFTIASSETFEVQHRCTTTKSTGFGKSNGFSVVEVYTDAKFWKVG